MLQILIMILILAPLPTKKVSLIKVNSVQEALTNYFSVHIFKFEILQTYEKTKQKASKY